VQAHTWAYGLQHTACYTAVAKSKGSHKQRVAVQLLPVPHKQGTLGWALPFAFHFISDAIANTGQPLLLAMLPLLLATASSKRISTAAAEGKRQRQKERQKEVII
jgi:hypothetical protein